MWKMFVLLSEWQYYNLMEDCSCLQADVHVKRYQALVLLSQKMLIMIEYI